jgi:hypothetical protein
VVTGTCSSATSNAATLDVSGDVGISDHPDSATVCEGSGVTFSVTASGAGLTYQWRKDGGNIGGATGSSYSIPAATAADAGSYDVVVTGDCGQQTSNAATLDVCDSSGPGDVDDDCDVDLEDLAVQLANYGVTSGATPEMGDMTGDGDIDLEDVAILLANFGASCG